MNVREQPRLVHDVRQLEDADDRPRPSGVVRSRSSTSNSGSPKKTSAPSCSRTTIERSSTPTDAARHAAVLGEDRLALVRREELERRREVLEVEQRQVVVVAVLEDEREDRGLGLVEVEHLAEQQRPERVDRRPDLGARACRTATGTRPGGPDGSNVQPSDATRSTSFGLAASPGAARPVRSPLMSATKTGTPAFDSWPASSWRVLVLPVPVAPAIRPWRLSIDSATWTRASLRELAVVHRAADDEARLGRARSRPSSRRGTPGPSVLRGHRGRSGEVGKRIIGTRPAAGMPGRRDRA